MFWFVKRSRHHGVMRRSSRQEDDDEETNFWWSSFKTTTTAEAERPKAPEKKKGSFFSSQPEEKVISSKKSEEGLSPAAVGLGVMVVAAIFANQFPLDDTSWLVAALHFVQKIDFGSMLEDVSKQVEAMGPLGVVYFVAVYVAAEVLALPAVPLTASAGYLFGAVEGTAVVLVAATIAAGISFLVGRFLLRGWVESVASESQQFRAIDAAVKREGFKIVLLLRLSPIFPFALSNYIYGLTAVDFLPYLAATLLGFAPGTALYVYGGEVASLVQGGGAGLSGAPFPWYEFYIFF